MGREGGKWEKEREQGKGVKASKFKLATALSIQTLDNHGSPNGPPLYLPPHITYLLNLSL